MAVLFRMRCHTFSDAVPRFMTAHGCDESFQGPAALAADFRIAEAAPTGERAGSSHYFVFIHGSTFSDAVPRFMTAHGCDESFQGPAALAADFRIEAAAPTGERAGSSHYFAFIHGSTFSDAVPGYMTAHGCDEFFQGPAALAADFRIAGPAPTVGELKLSTTGRAGNRWDF
ncbi:hypothetical protein [Puniceicoccus vermicola]|uniref:Uncharacterized protein n=1 Tax=Puniceicoccus vermicola TaxID=388746 RepID=A0A7X1E7U8_9BACT|nr:hypothetical protein [Puniceicoccus vermicola]MBC2604117.1 hypothetical protein [Puniceicoccus vermicola]